MVIVDKSKKSFKDCMDYVYYKLRISEPVINTDGKLTKVFHGISVNSWFTPMGISVSPEKQMASYSPINKDLRKKLQERANSASAVLGRRHFEVEQQEVGKDEVLQGSSLFKSNSSNLMQRKNIKSASGRFCGNSCSSSSGEIRSKILSQRPHTCHGTRADKTTYENLSICAKSLEISRSVRGSEVVNKNKEDKARLLSEFQTEQGMRDAFQMRVKSAPPIVHNIHGNTESDTTKSTIPLYWKTKSIYHRKQANGPGCDADGDSEEASRGSLWKPLLYAKEEGKKHKAGCPYRCKGCFRACLVSQDYMDKLLNGKVQLQQPRKCSTRPKFYHRKIVEYAIANAQPIKAMIENEEKAREKSTGEDF